MKVHNQEKVSCSSIQRINKRLKYIGSNQRRFARTLDSILVCMCAKRMVKGSGYISPVKRRIIAVEWHDHTDKVRKRKTGGKTKDGGGEWRKVGRGYPRPGGDGGEEFEMWRGEATST